MCKACGGVGFIEINECPRKYVGWELVQTINLAGHASKGMLPVSGGLAEQSAWFVDVMMTLENDQATIDRERIERERNRSNNGRY